MINVTTRHDARLLESTNPYPKFLADRRERVYEEVFINPGGEVSANLAKNHLRSIQEQHDKNHGWICESGHEGVFKDEDGKWYAFRHHAKYR